jgi:hypothetical protein
MNGEKAKRLRRLAGALIVKEGIKMGDGYNKYNQAMNRMDWEPMLDADGYPMKDPEGVGLMKPTKQPGTLTCAWKFRVMYQNLKKLSFENPKL